MWNTGHPVSAASASARVVFPAPDRPSIATSRAFPARGGRVRDASARDFTVSESNRSPPVFAWTTASSAGLPLAPSPSPGLAWRRASTVAWDGAAVAGRTTSALGSPGLLSLQRQCLARAGAAGGPACPPGRLRLLLPCVPRHPTPRPRSRRFFWEARCPSSTPQPAADTRGCSLDRAAARRGQYLRRLRQYGSQNRLFCVSWAKTLPSRLVSSHADSFSPP